LSGNLVSRQIGKEIYEFDVIRITHEYFGEENFGVGTKSDPFFCDACYLNNVGSENLQIIGNIYENPELMDE
jgi:hypothetical protein